MHYLRLLLLLTGNFNTAMPGLRSKLLNLQCLRASKTRQEEFTYPMAAESVLLSDKKVIYLLTDFEKYFLTLFKAIIFPVVSLL